MGCSHGLHGDIKIFPVSPRLDLVLLMTGTNDIGSVKPSGFSGEFIVEHETGLFFQPCSMGNA